MPSILDYLDNILNARYGQDVRSSIHDAIELCYSDVTSSQTVADNAALLANLAASSADAATAYALSAASAANAAASYATDTADGIASSAATAIEELQNQASIAIGNAGDVLNDAATAAATANSAANDAYAATGLVLEAYAAASEQMTKMVTATNEANAARDSASTAASSANAAASSANTAASSAADAVASVVAAISAASAATSDARAAIADCNSATHDASVAVQTINTAVSSIDNMTVTSENVPPSGTASAEISTIDGHKNIHFILKQGPQGEAFKILGAAYSTAEALEEAVLEGEINPKEGDQYNVGASAPYTIYRWTGEDWEAQGVFGNTINNLSNNEIDAAWSGSSITGGADKYLNGNAAYHLIYEKIVDALSGKVDKSGSKVLSDNNFTSEYKALIDTNAAAISTLTTSKVTAVEGKGLSTNDFTTELKSDLVANTNIIGSASLATSAQTITAAINELKNTIDSVTTLTASDISTSDNDSIQTHLTNIESTITSHTSTIATNSTNISTINTKLSNYLVIEGKTSPQLTISTPSSSGTASGNVNFSIAKTGYTPVAIAGITKSGTNSSYCFIYEFRIEGNNAKVYFRTSPGYGATITVTVYALYRKN